MTLDEINVLARGLAPVIRDLVTVATKHLVQEVADLRAQISDLEARDLTPVIDKAVGRAVAEIPAPKDGKDGAPGVDGRDGKDGVDGAPGVNGKDGADGKDGVSVDPADVTRIIEATVEKVLSTWERPKDGTSVSVDDVLPEIQSMVDRAVAALPPAERGADGAPGKLPVARAWDGGVTYEAEVRTHHGALWQAICDTGREPGGEDWICLAAAGENGRDADQIELCGTYQADGAYRRLSIVALNGGAFMAKTNDPGPCPGEGWQVIAMRGKAGPPGQSIKGDPGKGIKGDPGPGVVAMSVDGEGMLTLVNGDGSAVECDLYPVLSKLG